MRKITTLLFLLFYCTFSKAATLKGRITDSNGKPLSFASIYIKGTTKGTTSNIDGYYNFELTEGSKVIVCQYVGFQKQEFEMNILSGENKKNITLTANAKSLKEVVVKQGENPAIAIIKKTIKKRAFYNKQIDKFRANAYIKGNFKLRDIPKGGIMKMMVGNDTSDNKELENQKGILYLSESFNEIAYKRPDKLKVNVISTRVSGDRDSYGFSDPLFINFYDNNVEISQQLNPRGFISPIADAALLSYKYELLGAYMEDGKLINKIKVTPRRKYEPLFTGVIDIIENEWRLYSVDLATDKNHQLELIDTVRIKQIFVPVEDKLMVKDQSFYITANLFGFDIVGNYVNVFSDYNFSYNEKNVFNKFIKEYDKNALNQKGAYWDTLRPVPLDTDEVRDYVKKDSLEKVKDTMKVKPVVSKNSLRGFLFRGLIFKDSSTRFSTSPVIGLNNFAWNTVEGFNYEYKFKLVKNFGKDNLWKNALTTRYGFSNRQFNAKLTSTYEWGKTNQSSFALSGGRYVFQYNNENPVNPLINSFYTLLYGQNYLKFYQAWFASMTYNYRHISGFHFAGGLSYQDRQPLSNTNFYMLRRKENSFTENYPTEISSGFEPKHQALILNAGLSYQPGRKYIKYPDRIISTPSKYPTFGAQYYWGIPAFGSDVDYAKWKLTMYDDMNLNLWGTFVYRAAVGGFVYNNQSYIADYTHFNGNQIVLASPYLNSFQLSPYYLNSNTNKLYGTLNAEHHFNGLLTNKIPILRQLKWYLVAASNIYYVQQDNNYIEVSAGLENIGTDIFRFLRVDAVVGYSNLKSPVYGIRIGIKNNFLSIANGNED